jgi:hypothetical protein
LKNASFEVAGVSCVVTTISTATNINPKHYVYLFWVVPSFSIHPSTSSGRTEKDGKALLSEAGGLGHILRTVTDADNKIS